MSSAPAFQDAALQRAAEVCDDCAQGAARLGAVVGAPELEPVVVVVLGAVVVVRVDAQGPGVETELCPVGPGVEVAWGEPFNEP